MAQWQNGICGCLGDVGTCLITYFLPCITAGKNAEVVGKDCLLYGFLTTLGCIGIYTRGVVRQDLRGKYGIEGTFVNDLLCHCFCPVCALVQEAQEINSHGGAPGGMSMARE